MLGSVNDLGTCLVSGLVELVGISINKRLSNSLEVGYDFESFGRLRLGRVGGLSNTIRVRSSPESSNTLVYPKLSLRTS